MAYWLMKSEPDEFSIDDLAAAPDQTAAWDGVRNYQARNMLRDQVRVGDQVLFYHSSCVPPGVAGIAEVVREAYPDPSALDPDSPYHDPRAEGSEPRWFCVDVRFVRRFDRLISLARLREEPGLAGMKLLQRGNRLSVMPVSPAHWSLILSLADSPGKAESPERR